MRRSARCEGSGRGRRSAASGPGRLGGVEDDVGDEFLVLQARRRGQPVGERERDELLAVARRGHLRRFLAELRALPLRSARARERLLRSSFPPACPARRPLVQPGELLLDLFGGLVQERAGAEDDLDRAELRELRARPVRARPRSRAPSAARARTGSPPGRASARGPSPAPAAADCRGPAPPPALRRTAGRRSACRVGRARGRDEAAGRRAGLQLQREHRAADPEHAASASTSGARLAAPPASAASSLELLIDGAVGATPCRAARPRRRPGTAARTGFRMRTAPRPVPIRRSGPSRARRCAPRRAARS